MDLITRDFTVNAGLPAILQDDFTKRTYTWDADSSTDLCMMLNTCMDFERQGWKVALECPVTGVHRSFRIPVIATRDSAVLIIKPVKDPKKINLAGLKMLDIKYAVEETISGLDVRPVVYGFLSAFDQRRKTSNDYEIWLRG